MISANGTYDLGAIHPDTTAPGWYDLGLFDLGTFNTHALFAAIVGTAALGSCSAFRTYDFGECTYEHACVHMTVGTAAPGSCSTRREVPYDLGELCMSSRRMKYKISANEI